MDSIKKQMSPKKGFKEFPLQKSKGILDDHAVRKSIKTREFQMKTGSSLNNKVLTSDANGVGTWQTPGSFDIDTLPELSRPNTTDLVALSVSGTEKKAYIQNIPGVIINPSDIGLSNFNIPPNTTTTIKTIAIPAIRSEDMLELDMILKNNNAWNQYNFILYYNGVALATQPLANDVGVEHLIRLTFFPGLSGGNRYMLLEHISQAGVLREVLGLEAVDLTQGANFRVDVFNTAPIFPPTPPKNFGIDSFNGLENYGPLDFPPS